VLNPETPAEFDQFATDYRQTLNEGLRYTGESPDYFARRRIAWLRRRLGRRADEASRRVLDFGCGIGDSLPLLRDVLGAQQVVGTDTSVAMLAQARHRQPWAPIALPSDLTGLGTFSLVYCNGVFHHIPPHERPQVLWRIHEMLSPDGVLAFWENNPWNPGTRFIMRRVPFDRNAEPLSAPAAQQLLRATGFRVERTDHLFVFPSVLRALRPMEPLMARWPIGGQYLVLARRT
jgi:trans-aconitate methyltransferase